MQRWFPWFGLLAMPVAVVFAYPQDFRSPLILSPYSVSFGDMKVGKASLPQTVTVVNTGASPVHITNIAVAGDFTETNNCPVPPSALANNDTCEIQVVFKPSTTESCSGSLTLSQDAPAHPLTVALNGTGVLGGAEAAVSPSSLSFSEQKIGTTSAPQDITVSNKANQAILISEIASKGDFTVMPSSTCQTLGVSLPANSSCKVVVTFTSLTVGSRDGQVTITDNAENSPQIVSLTGTGSQ